MRGTIRIVTLLICLSLTFCLCSCEKEEPPRDYVESEVLSSAEELLEHSKLVNRLIWGVGLPILDDESAQKHGVYVEYDRTLAEEMGIQSVDDIRALCQEVYTTALCSSIEQTVFSALKDEDDNVLGYVRYYDAKKEVDNLEVSYIMVNTESTVYFDKEVEYHTETLKIKEVKGQIIYLTVEVTVLDGENNEHERTLTFSMLEEEGAWRLGSPSYIKYDPYADIYDDLVGQ